MRWMLIIIPIIIFSESAQASDIIINETKEQMLCVAKYPAVFEETQVDGRKERTKVKIQKEVISVLEPNQSAKKERVGVLKCYNEFEKIESFKDGTIQKTNKDSLGSHLTNHNKFDITQYEGNNRAFVETHFGIAQRCAPVQSGQYCNHGFGLDIIYDKSNKIKTVLLYGKTVQNGKLPFIPESIMQLRTGTEPLGLWVMQNYKKLFSQRPSVYSRNLIMWENLTKDIKRVTITPKNGYLEVSRTIKNGHNLFRAGWKDVEKGQDYIQAIEVQYK